jgi:lactate dehydrogenase-like 2-hydroxyacid dehydrogenase
VKADILIAGRVPPNVINQLEKDFVVHPFAEAPDPQALLAAVAQRVRGIATNAVQGVSVELLNALPNVEIIASSGIGTDALQLERARAAGIKVTATPDVLNDDVADMAIGLLLAVSRKICQGDRSVRAGRWFDGMGLGSRVSGKRLGILGLGRIGQALAKRAVAFDMTIGYHQRNRNPNVPYTYFDSVIELAEFSDFLVIVVPGGPATEKMVNRAVLDALGPDGTLVNVGRGSTVDEPALVEALAEGRIRAAALDVFADEPNVPSELLTMDNVVLAPHYASATLETRLAMGQLVVDNLRAHFSGRPLLTPVE